MHDDDAILNTAQTPAPIKPVRWGHLTEVTVAPEAVARLEAKEAAFAALAQPGALPAEQLARLVAEIQTALFGPYDLAAAWNDAARNHVGHVLAKHGLAPLTPLPVPIPWRVKP